MLYSCCYTPTLSIKWHLSSMKRAIIPMMPRTINWKKKKANMYTQWINSYEHTYKGRAINVIGEAERGRIYATRELVYMLQYYTRSFYQATLAEFTLRNSQIKPNSTTVRNVWKRHQLRETWYIWVGFF